MNIDFNSFYRLRVDIIEVPTLGQYQLTMERIDLEDTFKSSKSTYFFNKDQLKQFVDYINEASSGHI
jgi:hypothetical protein